MGCLFVCVLLSLVTFRCRQVPAAVHDGATVNGHARGAARLPLPRRVHGQVRRGSGVEPVPAVRGRAYGQPRGGAALRAQEGPADNDRAKGAGGARCHTRAS